MFTQLTRWMKESSYSVKRIFRVMKNPKKSSYFVETERKPGWAMWVDQFKWFARFREVNVFYFTYGLDNKRSRDISELVSWREFKRYRNRKNELLPDKKYNYVCLLQDKFVFSQFLSSLSFPAPKNLAIFDNKNFTWLGDMATVPLAAVVADTGLRIDGFAKKLNGILGEGAFTLKIEEGRFYNKNRELPLNELQNITQGQYLLQEKIIQHPKMAELHPSSVNTVRMVTFNNSGRVEVFSTVLRIGAKGNSVDNWASGGIIVSIDQETGRLGKEGMFKPQYGGKVTHHPETGVRFENFEIPFFKESTEMACKLHSFFYGIHSIGWDIGITPDGPIFIEGNDDWDGSIAMTLEPNFRSRYLKMFPQQEENNK